MAEKNTDFSNMKKIIRDFPGQFEVGLKAAENIGQKGDFKNIIICSIGGSALPANILLDWLPDLPLPLYIHRDYNLPPMADKDSLIICISYSGNTEEPVSALKKAIENNFKTAAITTGGKFEKICKENKIPFAKIPSGIQPRCAAGYIFSALIKILSNSNIIEDKTEEILKTAKELEKINNLQEKEGKILAEKLVKKMPIVYSSSQYKCIARIWKIKFNENSKIPAFYNYFPELNHNEMVGFSQINKENNFYILIIKDKDENPRNLKRMALFSRLIGKKGVKIKLIDIKKGTKLFKIFSSLLLGDWTSYYLALDYKIDPSPVQLVEEFKKEMEK